MTQVVAPGATLGVLGSGQLGRMFAIAARQMGYRVHVLSPDDQTPTGQVADVDVLAEYTDLDAVARFAQAVDVVTFEFENIPLATAATAAMHAPVRPAGTVLHTTQNRLREKEFLQHAGLPVTPFAAVHHASDLQRANEAIGTPAVLKTAEWGYDGKGQAKVLTADDAAAAWEQLGQTTCVWERWVDFAAELSVVAARGLHGEFRCFPPVRNVHHDHILDVSSSPAEFPDGVLRHAEEIARAVLTQLDVVGVLCIEFFLTKSDELWINELAPRPHNSGHLTIDAFATSQFEQQVRAVCGLTLGSAEPLCAAAMVNLLGDVWLPGPPNWTAALRNPNVKLHLYGKREPRRGRKMGHLTALADHPQEAIRLAIAAREALQGGDLTLT